MNWQRTAPMGIYQRVVLMHTTGVLNTTPDIPFLVYRLTFLDTGHFYIGETNDIKKRIAGHLTTIINLVNDKPCARALYVQKELALKIKPLFIKQKKVLLEKFCREKLSIHVIAIVDNKTTSKMLESHFIYKERDNKLCLNVYGKK